MNRASRYVILHEDKLHLVFVRYFLKKFGVSNHAIDSVRYTKGKGSGEQHVRNKYSNELVAYRRRASKATTVLIVVIDADAGTVEGHRRELDNAAHANGVNPRMPQENVVHIIPKWHIETWLAYLAGENVDENRDYKRQYGYSGRESDCHALIDRLFEACKHYQTLTNIPPSLEDACQEFLRIRPLL